MARTAYHITDGSPDAGHIKVAPDEWYNVGASILTYVVAAPPLGASLLINTQEDSATAYSYRTTGWAAVETSGRNVFIKGPEGYKVITDDGNA
jgi:hypothetical protein